MKTIQELAQGLAAHLREAAPTVADLPDTTTLSSFLVEGLRYQLGAATTHVEAFHSDGTAVMPVGDAPGALAEQVGGNHYKEMKIQHAEFCQANNLPYCESAAMKYLCRHQRKGKLEDLRKAIHYIRLAGKLTYGQEI